MRRPYDRDTVPTMRLGLTLGSAVLLALCFITPAHARRGIRIPFQLRMTTYVGEKLEGIKPDFEWLVSHRGKEYTLYVLNLVVMDGRATPLDIDAAVRPYRINFQLAGTTEEIQKLITTPPREQIVITAFANFGGGARMLMVSKVEKAPEATPVPTAATDP
jgi:hypothetical protein